MILFHKHQIFEPSLQPDRGVPLNVNLPKASQSENLKMLELLLMFIVTSGSPFRLVENTYFIQLCSLLMESRSAFKLPSRRVLKTLVRKEAQKKRDDLKQKLANVKNISLTTDCWSSTKQKTGYIGVTVHFFKNQILHSFNLGIKQVIGNYLI